MSRLIELATGTVAAGKNIAAFDAVADILRRDPEAKFAFIDGSDSAGKVREGF